MNTRIDISTLSREIEGAFDSLPPPKDDEILRERVADTEYGGNKTAGLAGIRWFDLPEQFYSKEKDWYFLPWLMDLTPAAFCYYLPGYMMLAVHYYNKCDSDSIVQSLIVYTAYEIFDEKRKDHILRLQQTVADEKRKTFELFSLRQKHVIKMFLEYLIQNYGEDVKFSNPKLTPQEALAQYWRVY